MSDETGASGPLLLLDGMSLAYRAYFALPPDLATKDGRVTNALHGFASMLVYLVRDQSPSGVGVAFDLPGETFRDEMIDDYKAGRAETPDDLLPQFDMIREMLRSLAIPLVEAPGFEADDVLATLATAARDRQREVVVVTGDRDSFQLVEDPYIRVLYNRRGVSDYTLYDEAGILDRTGVLPPLYPMLAALRGDTSDNLPGVPGVGEKTAAKLLNSYGDLDGIFAHLSELSPKLRENLAANEDLARSNARVIPLVRDVPLDVDPDDLTLGGWDKSEAEGFFTAHELTSVWGRLQPLFDGGSLGAGTGASEGAVPQPSRSASKKVPGSSASPPTSTEAKLPALNEMLAVAVHLERPSTPKEGAAALKDLSTRLDDEVLALAGSSEGDPGRSPLRGLALEIGASGQGLWLSAELLSAKPVHEALRELLATHKVCGHDVKELMRSLLPLGVDIGILAMDTAVAAYLLDASEGDYRLDALTGRSTAAAAGGRRNSAQLTLAMEEVDPAEAAGDEAAAAAQLAPGLRSRMEADQLVGLFDDVECPLVRVLARMEVEGIKVDTKELRRISDELAGDCARLEAEIHRLAGHEFNVNSTPQLRTVLYDELGLTPGRKTKTGYSTDAATLETLRDVHPIVETLLEYREVEKLRSTYGESLLAEVAPDGRIHASFRQTVARTGRLSSERPNLHNIPVRTEAGNRFRRAFVPEDGASFLVADYDQIELRVIAHLSGDPGLLEAFSSGADIHRAVAASVYSIPPGEVSHRQREFVKMVSYGLAYGMEAFGLARRLATSVEEATEIMGRYFAAFPYVRDHMDATVAEARKVGFTRTELGRKRPLPELTDSNYRVRQAAERQAMNAGIQGLAADIFKIALVRLDAALEDSDLRSRLVLQVHDEVIVEVPGGEEEAAADLTREALTGAVSLSVPLGVSMAFGESWAAAKEK
jgi:DNA polymerase-1